MKTKTQKLLLDGYGSFLGMEKGCFVVRDKQGNVEKYPLFESGIGEIQIKSSNMVSSGAVASCGFWGIDCLFLARTRVAMLKSLDDDSHVKTRVCQYEALKTEKATHIAKQFVLGKLEGQNQVLRKYGLKRHDFSVAENVQNLKAERAEKLRTRLMSVEGHFSENYFNQVFSLVSEPLRPEGRRAFKAYSDVNNLFNLAYEVLSWKVLARANYTNNSIN